MVRNLVVGTYKVGDRCGRPGAVNNPTVEVAVPMEGAAGGIILTASHNPKQWNALKLLNAKGEFISAADGQYILSVAEEDAYSFTEVTELGNVVENDTYLKKHIDAVLALKGVDVEAIRAARFKVVCDCVNSPVEYLCRAIESIGSGAGRELFCEPTDIFRTTLPLPNDLTDISEK